VSPRFLPASVAASLLFIFLDIFAIGQILFHLRKEGQRLSMALKDMKSMQAIALLLLELLTVVPSLMRNNLLVRFIPLSIGSLIVLCE